MQRWQYTMLSASQGPGLTVPSTVTAYMITIGAPGYRMEASSVKQVGDGDLGLNFVLEEDATLSGTLYTLTGKFSVSGYDGKIVWTNQQMSFSTIVPPPALRPPSGVLRAS